MDYEDENQRSFTFTLEVRDGQNYQPNSTRVVITVEDFNDNAPVFSETEISKEMVEEQPPGFIDVTFSATDADSGINKEFT